MEIQLWRDLLDPYDLAVRELITKLEHIRYEHSVRGLYCPMEQVTGRVKAVSSILDKMQRKNLEFDQLQEEMDDIAGIRIICQFVEDIPKVVAMIHNRDDMEVVREKDYIVHPKESGYRSYHMIIRYHVETMDGPKKLFAEIQIRTMGMNVWATIEHSMQYKYRDNIPDHLREKLSKSSELIVNVDNEMSLVRDEIMDAQNSMRRHANLVSEILLTIEGLYSYANEREIVKIQDEFYEIYKEGNIEKLERFYKQLDMIAEGYRAQKISFESTEI